MYNSKIPCSPSSNSELFASERNVGEVKLSHNFLI